VSLSTTAPTPASFARAAPGARTRWVGPALLALGLLHGLIYVFLVPPWQHYDEPGHFLYAALVARGGPAAPDDTALSREVADSLFRQGFWPDGFRPDLLGAGPVPVGSEQRVHPPLYYVLAAGPIRLLDGLAVERQLFAARLLSLALYGVALLAAWRIALTVLPDEPAAVVPLALLFGLTPAFADVMTAVNNDVLANACLVVALLGCALLLRDGPRPAGLALALLGLVAACMAKRTAVVGVVPVALAVFWSLRRAPLPWWGYLAAGAGALGLGALLGLRLEWGEAGVRLVARSWLAELDRAYLRLRIDAWLASAADLGRAGPLYGIVLQLLFVSFWTHFGWGQIRLGPAAELLVALVALAGAAGLALRARRGQADLPLWQQRWIWLCAVAVCCAWLAAVARMHPLPAQGLDSYLPRGRYMFWALLPTLWLLALGWQAILPERWRPRGLYGLVVAMALLDLAALAALASAYLRFGAG